MGSSFMSQIPTVLDLLQQIHPRNMLDVGKGFGKYGFLVHEYFGIPIAVRPDPGRMLREQSMVVIDAVESNPFYMWPHLDHIYRKIYVGRVEQLLKQFPHYDLVLMCDVLEHLNKADGATVVHWFLSRDSILLVTTPKNWFKQAALHENPDEEHKSYRAPEDFKQFGSWFAWQNLGPGRAFILSRQPLRLRAFGRPPINRAKRIAHAILNEL